VVVGNAGGGSLLLCGVRGMRVASSSSMQTMITILDTTLLIYISRWDMYLGIWARVMY
jgi:hypothetical protein